MEADDRKAKIESFVASIGGSVRTIGSGNFYSGPYDNKKITKVGYAEFASTDAAQDALAQLKDRWFNAGGAVITVKPALTKLNGARNYALRKAEELIKQDAKTGSKPKKINYKTSESGVRNITVGGDVAFVQTKADTSGTCQPPYHTLSLP